MGTNNHQIIQIIIELSRCWESRNT